jgi:hypothetical protein
VLAPEQDAAGRVELGLVLARVARVELGLVLAAEQDAVACATSCR